MPASGVLLVVLGIAPLHAQAAPARVFREITLAPVGRVALGEPLAEPGRFTQVGQGLYEVKPPDGPARSIMVAVDSSNSVRAVVVVYGRGRDYAAARAAHIRKLGPPEEIDEVEEGAIIKGAAWQDSTTYFAIVNRRFTDSLPDVVELLRDQ
jgi:hypothetical protein